MCIMWIRVSCYCKMTRALNLAYARRKFCNFRALGFLLPWLNANESHHPAILVLQKMAVINKSADCVLGSRKSILSFTIG